jgi:hypothetical protein
MGVLFMSLKRNTLVGNICMPSINIDVSEFKSGYILSQLLSIYIIPSGLKMHIFDLLRNK